MNNIIDHVMQLKQRHHCTRVYVEGTKDKDRRISRESRLYKRGYMGVPHDYITQLFSIICKSVTNI
jgi:hypothetical protein